jgi:hypothetical protein
VVRQNVFRKDRIVLALAAAGATLTGGIVSYSIAVASPAVPEARSEMAVEGRPIDCNFPTPDLDWYLQRGDRMLSNEMLPNTVSFRSSGSGLHPAGDPCEDDGDGGGGGGGGGSSCLSDFGFDPTDYWVVLEKLTTNDYTAVDVFAATDGSLTALSGTDIGTTTGCTVSYEWAFVETGEPVSGLLGFWGATGVGASSPLLEISGMSADGMNWAQLYGLYICDDLLGLKVTDGTNDYFITAPPCGVYNLSSLAYTLGAGFKFEYQDPWSRDEVIDQNPDDLATGGGSFVSFAAVATVKLNSPLTITFYKTGFYTLKTGSDVTVNCDEVSLSEVFNSQSQAANTTWSEPSPSTDRFYCVTEELP